MDNFSGSQSRCTQLRAESSAILTGINTVLADDPALNARLPGMLCNH